MGREWKPGDVGVVTDGEVERVAVRAPHGWSYDVNGIGRIFANIRPLLVIDPEDREQVDALCKVLVEAMYAAPKPDEPLGLGAVVEDADGERFVRWKSRGRAERHWKGEGDGDYRTWASIPAIKVLSEGVQS